MIRAIDMGAAATTSRNAVELSRFVIGQTLGSTRSSRVDVTEKFLKLEAARH